MRVNKGSMLLYAVTDRSWIGENKLENQVEEIIKAGVTFIQLREKDLDFDRFLCEAKKIKEITDRYNIPFVINDNIEVALAAGADGVHVGQNDISVDKARTLIGNDKILGVSVQTVDQAIAAQANGADYIGVGAVFTTSSKKDADNVSFDILRAICESVDIPVIAIGGINEKNITDLNGSGIDGVAVISAIFSKPDIAAAAGRLLGLSKELVKGR